MSVGIFSQIKLISAARSSRQTNISSQASICLHLVQNHGSSKAKMNGRGKRMALCLTGGKALNGMLVTNFIRSDLVNLRKSSNRVSRLLLSFVLLGAGANLWAQQPRYVAPPPPTKHTQFQLRLRYMMPPDVGFTGLGSVAFLDSYCLNDPLTILPETSVLRYSMMASLPRTTSTPTRLKAT